MFKLKAPSCQSCGMPMTKDPAGGGSNGDGTKSTLYCSYCFENGQFIDPKLTLDQMTIKVKDKLKVMFIPKLLIRYVTKDLPNLIRWKMKRKDRTLQE